MIEPTEHLVVSIKFKYQENKRRRKKIKKNIYIFLS